MIFNTVQLVVQHSALILTRSSAHAITINFVGGNATFNAGSQFIGAGSTLVSSNASFSGAFTSSNLALGGGNKFLNGATLTNQGTIVWQTGNTLFFQNGTNLANQGTIDLQTNAVMVNNGGPASTSINKGLITKTGGAGTSTIGNGLGFDNQGVVNVSTGTIHLPDNFTNHGTLKGTGAFTTNVLMTNAGHVAPGSSPGTLTLNGSYVQTATGFLDIEVATSALVDTFHINGTASLNGTLALSCVPTCNLHDGDVFVILSATGALSGTFATVTAANFGIGFQYDIIYDNNAGQVKLSVIHAGAQHVLDVDGNNTYDALADGLLIIRYLFGLTGPALTDGAIGSGATRTDPTAMLTQLNNISPQLDVDGNGQADALTDGLLLIRYLFGLRGASLIAGAVAPDATRTTTPDIEAYILSLMQ